jgi:dTDP-4-amino-4,6-dideoxygalactose transaminase
VDRRFRFERAGFSYRCTELEAAIGLGQLDNHEDNVAARRANAAYLNEQLSDLGEFLQLPTQPPDRDHSYMVYPLVVMAESGQASMRPLVYHLEEHGIETRDMLPLIHQPVYRPWLGPDAGKRFPVAHQLHDRAFYIGCHQHLSPQDREHIVSTIRRFFEPH